MKKHLGASIIRFVKKGRGRTTEVGDLGYYAGFIQVSLE